MNQNNNRRHFIRSTAIAGIGTTLLPSAMAGFFPAAPPLLQTGKVGIIGLDTSHSEAFTETLNHPHAPADVAGFPVVAAYPYGSKTIESSYNRIPEVTEAMKKRGVRIVNSIADLLKEVDVVLLETNDGKLHLEQAIEVMKAGKRLFIDKPIAHNLSDTVAIFQASKKYKVPLFSSSSLRYTPAIQELAAGQTIGKITGADVYTPCSLEPSHGDLFWYGIHGIETIYTLMGKGCVEVTRIHDENTDVVTGRWSDGRIATFRGTRTGPHDYGATVFGEKGIKNVSAYAGYVHLVREITKFFRTGIPPVSPEETTEICAFMEAADESKKKNGAAVSLRSVMDKIKA